MPASREFTLVALSAIKVAEDRQRQNYGDLGSLTHSIRHRGLLQPLVVDRDLNLQAGGRRTRALWNLADEGELDPDAALIPVQFFDELAPHDRKIVELEENVIRKQLNWQEQCRAIAEYHELRSSEDDSWSATRTATVLYLSPTTVYQSLEVASALAKGDDSIRVAETFRTAVRILESRRVRAASSQRMEQEDLTDELLGEQFDDEAPLFDDIEISEEDETEALSAVEPNETKAPAPAPVRARKEDRVVPLLKAGDFREFLQEPPSAPYNFIHCDFPYGIDIDQANVGALLRGNLRYSDDEDYHFSLLETLLGALPRIMPQGHLMYWFSMRHKARIEEAILRRAADPDSVRIYQHPLIWHKTHGRGFVSDPRYYPRHIYETALLVSYGNQPIVKVFNDVCGSGGESSEHGSVKPTEMLEHFFAGLVDEHTRFLDPTCGSGTSVVAALRQGAKSITALDINPKAVEEAQFRLDREYLLQKEAS